MHSVVRLLSREWSESERSTLPKVAVSSLAESLSAASLLSEHRSLLRQMRVIVGELAENLVRYADWQDDKKPKLEVLFDKETKSLRVLTKNTVNTERASLDRLFGTLQKIESLGAEQAFRVRMLEAGTEPLDAPTRLGLLRIAHEGAAQLSASVCDDATLELSATVMLV